MKDFEYRGQPISMGEARKRSGHTRQLPSGKVVPAPLCYNCSKPVTAVELNSCGSRECNKVLRPLYRWAAQFAARVVAA